MKLFGTPPSHFTRKVRVVLQELQIPYEFIVLDKLQEVGAEKFADNPLHQFPVLEDKGLRLIESDIICEYLIQNYGQKNPNLVFLPKGPQFWEDSNRLAIMNGGMLAGVRIIRGQRSNITDLMSYPLFQQERASIDASLSWLEKDCPSKAYHPGKLTMLDISLVAFYEWARFREMTKLELPRIHAFVENNKASFAETHPALGVKK